MGDSYKHNAEGISSVVSSLQVLINDYKEKVNRKSKVFAF